MNGFELLIVRHADPDYEQDRLTERGRREAAALAVRFSRTPPDAIFSSPLGRARETADVTARAIGVEVEVLDWAAELEQLIGLDGLEGLDAVWDVPGAWVRSDAGAPRLWDGIPAATAAAIRDAEATAEAGSAALLARFGMHPHHGVYRLDAGWRPRRIALFCHAGLGMTLLAHLLQLPLERAWAGFYLPPASVTRVLFERREARAAAPRALGVGDVAHLVAAGVPENRRGLHGFDES